MAKKKLQRKDKEKIRLKREVGIEPPPRKAYDFESFEKGESHFIETRVEMRRIRNAAYAWARRVNKKNEDNPSFAPIEFRCCKHGEGWRLFRTE